LEFEEYEHDEQSRHQENCGADEGERYFFLSHLPVRVHFFLGREVRKSDYYPNKDQENAVTVDYSQRELM
jgi:hypothetical protein